MRLGDAIARAGAAIDEIAEIEDARLGAIGVDHGQNQVIAIGQPFGFAMHVASRLSDRNAHDRAFTKTSSQVKSASPAHISPKLRALKGPKLSP